MSAEPDPEVFDVELDDSPRTHLTNLRPTGSYGITPVWEDGHDYGIYNWHFLRRCAPAGMQEADLGKRCLIDLVTLSWEKSCL